MSWGPLVEQAVTTQVVFLAIVALIAGIIVGVIATVLIRRGRSGP